MIVNGKNITLEQLESNSIQALLSFLKLKPETVAVEINHAIQNKDKWSDVSLKEEDKVEIIKFVGAVDLNQNNDKFLLAQAKLYPILDVDYSATRGIDIFALVRFWLDFPEYIKFIQLRGKSTSLQEYKQIYKNLIKENPNLKIIVNDHWEFASEVSAFGIHLGKEDFAGLRESELTRFCQIPCLKGTSSHSLEDIRNLDLKIWDYTGLGPMFPTTTKVSGYTTLGPEILKKAISISNIRIVPIGGISVQNFPQVLLSDQILPASIGAFSEKKDFIKIMQVLIEKQNSLEK